MPYRKPAIGQKQTFPPIFLSFHLMKKILMASLLVAISVCAKAQDPAQDNRLSPVKPGDQWSYKQFDEAGSKDAAIAHFKIGWKTKQGELAVLANYGGLTVGPETLWKTMYFLTPDVCMLDVASGEHLSPLHPYDLSLVTGTTWESDTSDKFTRTHNRFKVISLEEVHVPAGIYHAFKIDRVAAVRVTADPDLGEKRVHTIYWYAPEIRGMAKIVRETSDPGDISSSKVIEELQSTFTK